MLRRQRSDATERDEDPRATNRRRREGRGLGPFSGGQLTVVIVAIAAMFAIPTAALAAGGAFTSNSATVPAVKATNTNAHGVGVSGAGKRFGVFSNGPLGVAAGKSLSCAGCVGSGALHAASVGASALQAGSVGASALSASANVLQPLGSGESETGVASGGAGSSATGYIAGGVTFTRPVPGYASLTTATGTSDPTHCPGVGSASPGYLCAYAGPATNANLAQAVIINQYGGYMYWTVTGNTPASFAAGEYTVTAA